MSRIVVLVQYRALPDQIDAARRADAFLAGPPELSFWHSAATTGLAKWFPMPIET